MSIFNSKSTSNIDRSFFSRANCYGVDPDIFVIDRGDSYKKARSYCELCSVRIECLDYSIQIGETRSGMFGGVPPKGRARLVRGIRKEAERGSAEA